MTHHFSSFQISMARFQFANSRTRCANSPLKIWMGQKLLHFVMQRNQKIIQAFHSGSRPFPSRSGPRLQSECLCNAPPNSPPQPAVLSSELYHSRAAEDKLWGSPYEARTKLTPKDSQHADGCPHPMKLCLAPQESSPTISDRVLEPATSSWLCSSQRRACCWYRSVKKKQKVLRTSTPI